MTVERQGRNHMKYISIEFTYVPGRTEKTYEKYYNEKYSEYFCRFRIWRFGLSIYIANASKE